MTNSETVLAMIKGWEARDMDAILATMTEDVVYTNIGMNTVVGHEAVRTSLTPFIAMASEVKWTVHHIAENASGVVMTERLDEFVIGPKKLAIAVMGICEFRDGKICAWRDYFDVPAFNAQMAG
jgi:limonene-1,2-epoxide hydrolase